MIMVYSDFERIINHYISNLAPGGSKNAIEFDILVNGEKTTIRSFAPFRDYQFWARLPKEHFKKFVNGINKTRVYQDWQSDWVQLQKLSFLNGNENVDVLEIRYGVLPIMSKFQYQINLKELFYPITGEVIKFNYSTPYELYFSTLKLFHNKENKLWMSFGLNKRRKQIDVIDSDTLRLTPPSYTKDKPQFTDFTQEGFESLLSEPDWRFLNIQKTQKVIL